MADAFRQQAQTAEKLQQIVDNFNKDPANRKIRSYYVERLRRLEEQWLTFEQQDTHLRESPDADLNHSYFTKDVYTTIRDIYRRYKAIFSAQIQALSSEVSSHTGDAVQNDNDDTKSSSTNKQQLYGTSDTRALQDEERIRTAVRRQEQLFEALDRMLLRITYDQPSKSYVDLKSATIHRMWSQIENQHLDICGYSTNPEQHQYNSNQYIELEGRVQETLVKLQESQVSQATKIDVKLPTITLPKFDGEYSKWIQFRDLFKQMIHKQPMAECQKLWYLKANVTSEAEKLISHLTTSSENYSAAWKILEDRYENKRLLEAVFINKLLSQPKQLNDNTSQQSIRALHDTTKECLLGLKSMGLDINSWDPILVNILIKKLDRTSHTLFEQSLHNPKETPALSQLMKFLENRFQSLEALGDSKKVSSHHAKPNVKTLTSVFTPCVCCKGQHPLFACKSFLKSSIPERIQFAQKNHLCLNCLKTGHRHAECTLGSCPQCQKKHNSLLHLNNNNIRTVQLSPKRITEHQASQPRAIQQTAGHSSKVSTATATSSATVPKGYVLLNTAWVHLTTDSGTIIKGRAILDSGSQVNIITERIARKLGVATKSTSMQIEGIGNGRQTATKRANVVLLADNISERVETYVLSTIIPPQPTRKLDITEWNIPTDIVLADPGFHTPGPIDILLGAEWFHQMLRPGQIKLAGGLPILQNTIFGWIVAGKIQEDQSESFTCGISVQDVELNKTLEKFWQLEEFKVGGTQLTPAEKWCENHFTQTTTKTTSGRFVVKLPFVTEPSTLGESKDIAIRRFLSLEKRLIRNPALYSEYTKFIKEYEALGHMREVELSTISDKHCFLPHHCVIKPESSTTKLRVVFDASAKTSSQLSLNDILHTGPKIQDELWIMLLRFRFPQFVFSADIQQMYRQVFVHDEDQRFQLILWRSHPEESLKCYKLCTVTYGTSAAPYLAMRCLAQLAQEGVRKYPLASKILQKNFYVDNAIAGASSLSEAIESQKQLIELLSSAGFKLRKWSSNHPKLLENIPLDDREIEVALPKNKEGGIQTLGLIWMPRTDTLQIKINTQSHETTTKRTIVADLAKIFDPLGLLAPIIVSAKIITQEVTKLNIDWDAPIPSSIRTKWEEFKEGLELLHDISIPRHVFSSKIPVDTQLHVFSDASEKAYGAAIYIRSKDSSGSIVVRLLCAKSRIAPLKTQSIPRLELCAAKLGCDLAQKIQHELELKNTRIFYWTDSQIVLQWIHAASSSYVTFVANRIAAIQELTTREQWRHVRSGDNPADALSRGLTSSRLTKEHMWFYGPLFLHGRQSEWPPQFKTTIDCDLEKKRTAVNAMTTASNRSHESTSFYKEINHHNSFRRLQRIIAYMLRFKNQKSEHPATSPKQLEQGLEVIIRNIQQERFTDDIKHIQRYNYVSHNSPLASLTPFIDEKGLVRAGGRLMASSSLSYDAKHPMILPYDHPLTKSFMIEIHNENLHLGAQALLAKIRQRFWPVKGKTLARSVIQQCVKCARAKPKLMSQVMGNLPSHRIEPARPFVNSGVDFCGPIWIHYQLRGKRPQKSYIAVFICFATKAVHLEVVSNLTTDAFVGALKRFMGRRGLCKNLYCDNATNFVGAKNQLEELNISIYSKPATEKIQNECSKQNIHFHFIPPRAPHFGGLWEAAVKVAKNILRKAVGSASLTYEQLETTLIEIEAIMNSRPLVPMSSDPNDLTALTPGHFLIGEPLTSMVDPNTEERRLKLSERWKLICQIKNDFWRRWKTEYLQQLQHKAQWKTTYDNVKPGRMVILKEDNVPVLKWPLGRILECHFGSDGKVRVVDVRTASGVFRRAIHHLAPLPINDELPAGEKSDELTEKTPEEQEVEVAVQAAQTREAKLNKKLVELFGSESSDESDTTPTISARHPKRTIRTEAPDAKTPQKRARSAAGSALVTLLLASTMFPSTSASIQTQTFENRPGLYFDNVGKINLIAHEWNLIIYYNLQPYWAEYRLFAKGIEMLQTICDKSTENNICESMAMQFKHMEELLRKDNALLRFRRTESSLKRRKRGAINFIGNIANSLFGVLDENYANEMSHTIRRVKMNEEYLLTLLKNQTSLIDATTNIIKRDETAIDQKFKELEAHTSQLKNTIQQENQRMTELQVLSIDMLLTMSNIQETQNAIINILIDAQHQKISPRLITPDQLQTELLTIKSHIPHTYRLPADASDLATIYKALTAKAWIDAEQLILELKLPLLALDTLEMFKLLPIPAIDNDAMIIIKPRFTFIAISPHRDEFYPMPQQEQNNCREINDGRYWCEQTHPLYRTDGGIAKCEMNMFNHLPVNNECQTTTVNENSKWIQLSTRNQWIYSVKSTTTLHAVCGKNTSTVHLQGSGILTISPSCTVKGSQLTIYGHHKYVMTDHTSYVRIGINTSLPAVRPTTTPTDAPVSNKPNNEEIEGIKKALAAMDLKLPNDFNDDIPHHVAVSYAGLGIAMITILVVTWKLTSCGWGCKRNPTIATAETNKSSSAQTGHTISEATPDSDSINIFDAKFVLKRYEDYAYETISSISNYFNYLHAALQNIERNAHFRVRDHAVKILSKIQRHQASLKKGQETLEVNMTSLENTCTSVPINFPISKLIEKTNSLLESIPCNIEFEGADNNPFEFIEKRKPPVDFPNLFELNINPDNFHPKILTFFGDSSSLECSIDSVSDPKPKRNLNTTAPPKVQNQGGKKSKSKKSKASLPPTKSDGILRADYNLSNISTSSFSPKQLTTQKVHVSHIKNPENFYVQVQKYLSAQTEFQSCIMNEVEYAPSPDYIEIGQMYLVFNATNHTWYRGEVLNCPSTDLYNVFLIDYGNTIQVPKQRFHVISETLKSKPPGAIQCSLYAIKPIRNGWTDKANQLMSEIIVNEMINLVIYKEDTIYQVDLITIHLHYPTSVRNALIFAELALDDINISMEMVKRVQQLSSVRKSLLTPPADKFYKNVFKEGESFRAIILNATDPHDFYAIKYDYKIVVDNLYMELNNEYKEVQQKLYTPLINTPCAVLIEGSWFRARITKIVSCSKVTVWLVDKAQQETVRYDQLRTLQSKYLSLNECAFQCSLADIEPLQKNNYAWTPNAVVEFQRMIHNPVLQIFVHRTQNFLHQIGLYIIKKELDVNINALLVKYKHANSTGSESQHIEYPKVVENPEPDDDMLHDINIMEMTLIDKTRSSSNTRTKIKICHIISPGEFYVRKIEHLPGINKLQEEIQSYRRKDELAPCKPYEGEAQEDEECAKWKVNGMCLVRLNLNEAEIKQWYRAMIKEIHESESDEKFTVFLRDYGQTFEEITAENIAPIPGVYNRVCDGAIKCHTACIQPTGGLNSWSGAAVDEFRAAVNRFEEIGATIQGTREGDSIPVILWGLRRECSDPLAATLYKWVNINKFLSNSGLAHLTEKFTKLTDENTLQFDVQDGQETFNEWLEHLNETVDRQLEGAVGGLTTILKNNSDDEEICVSDAELFSDDEENKEFTTWLPPRDVKKSVFIGIPTFVDNDGVIYMYDAAQKPVFDNVSVVVNKVVTRTRKGYEDSFWYQGQPCLAQYSVDGKFYRAIVLETKPDRRVSVQFVDYGNIQECSTKDLRKNVVLTNIPIQVTKYRLDDILPPDDLKAFSLYALDFLYANIVNKQCAIRISEDQENEDIKLCSIKCGQSDAAELMITNGYARRPPVHSRESFLDAIISPAKRRTKKWSQIKDSDTSSELEEAIAKIEDDMKEVASGQNSDIIVEEIVSRKPSASGDEIQDILDTNAYQQLFEKIDLDELCAPTKKGNSSHSNSSVVESTYKPAYCTGSVYDPDVSDDETVALVENADTTPSSFDPKELSTSTKFDKKPRHDDVRPFEQAKLPSDTKTFTCEVTHLFDATTLALYPVISSHKKLIIEMAKRVQIAGTLSPPLKNYEPGTPCLAMYSEDNMWYRCLIRSYNAKEERADVVFVDFYNGEWVSCKKIRQIPLDLIDIPLRNINVKLAGVKPNPRWRDSDIQRKFSDLVCDRRLFAKIASYDNDKLIVELYENVESDDLIYEQMIANRFYLKN